MKFIALAAAAAAISLKEKIDPVNPTGLEPAPSDPWYDDIYQRRAPLIWENWRDTNDWKKYYVDSKHQHDLGNYIQLDDAAIPELQPTSAKNLNLEHCPDQMAKFGGVYDVRRTLADGQTEAIPYPKAGYNCIN